MRYKGAIFDLDGTILDSIPLWSGVGERYLLSLGIVPPPQLKRALKNMSLRQAAEHFIEAFQLDLTPDGVIQEINGLIADHYKKTLQLKPYVKEFLMALKSKGVKMCIATMSDKALTESALARLGVLSCFEFVLTCEEVGASKDQPDIYLQAAQGLGLPIEEVLVFEDSPHCIETAKTAGFTVVGVYESTAGDRVERMKRFSDHFIYSFQDLEYLKALFE